MSEHESFFPEEWYHLLYRFSVWGKWEYIYKSAEEFCTDFLRVLIFLYITQALSINFPIKKLLYAKIFMLSYSIDKQSRLFPIYVSTKSFSTQGVKFSPSAPCLL